MLVNIFKVTFDSQGEMSVSTYLKVVLPLVGLMGAQLRYKATCVNEAAVAESGSDKLRYEN